ncbi:MAG: hypothetical protein EBV98_05235, partial [Actinobacteria bacterium]|nr:hypothetical protein [Actinomycetota bacterium]
MSGDDIKGNAATPDDYANYLASIKQYTLMVDQGDGTYIKEIIAPNGPGTATLTATVDDDDLPTELVEFIVGEADKLAFNLQASGASSGKTLDVQPVILIQDEAGNTVTNSNAEVTVSISGDATLSGTTAVEAESGVATFTDLAISGTAGEYTLSFTSGDMTQVSQVITLIPGDVSLANSILVAGTNEITAGESTLITLTLRDASGNTVPDSSGSVALVASHGSISGGKYSELGIYTANFSSTLGSDALITATLDGADVTNQLTIGVIPAAISSTVSTFVTDTDSVLANGTAVATLTVTLKDAYGNAISGQELSINGIGRASLEAMNAETSTEGTAVFTLSNTLVETLTLTAAAGDLSLSTSVVVTFTDATAPIIAAGQSFTYAENSILETVIGTVQAQDSMGVTEFEIVSGEYASSFAISSEGMISRVEGFAAATNDFELAPNVFELGIVASDEAGNRSEVVLVEVSVTDENDNAPYFTQTIGDVSLSEGVVAGTVVATAEAADVDQNDTQTYSLESTFGDTLAIDGASGEITTSGLDYEVSTGYRVGVIVADA